MKVKFPLTITKQKNVNMSKFKKKYSYCSFSLKNFVKDVFSRTTKTAKIVARKEPNWCQGFDDFQNNAVVKIQTTFEKANVPLKEIGLDLKNFIVR